MRRAPFSDNPRVGARGQRTRQRILNAALQLFGDEGYHRCSVARISEQADCSRVSFYQYFSSKEDVFSSLAGQVAREISASTEAIEPLTPEAAGWDGLRAWVGRYGDIHEHYGPIFQALPAALAEDDEMIAAAARLRDQTRGPDPLDVVDGRSAAAASSTPCSRCCSPACEDARQRRHHCGCSPQRTTRGSGSRSPSPTSCTVRSSAAMPVNVHAVERGPSATTRVRAGHPGHVGEGGGDPVGTPSSRAALRALMDNGRDVFVRRGLSRHSGGRPG